MMTKTKKANGIQPDQIDTLINIRDQEKMSQKNLYERIGIICGRIIKHLRNLNKHEASHVITKLQISSNDHNPVEAKKESNVEPIKETSENTVAPKELTFAERFKLAAEKNKKST